MQELTFKVSAGFGISGMLVAMAALFVAGIGIVIALGAVIVLSPLTGAVFIIVLFMIMLFVFGGGPHKTLLATVCLFVILAILFGKQIQSTFEMISPIFGLLEVIL